MSTEQTKNPLLQEQSKSLREKQMAVLNDDKMNIPKKKIFQFHLDVFILTLFQLGTVWFFYQILYYQTNNSSNSDIDSFEQPQMIKTRSDSLHDRSQHKGQGEGTNGTLGYVIISLAYLVLGFASYRISSIKRHFQNAKGIGQLMECYNEMRKAAVKLQFKIQCYHEEQTYESDRGKQTKKVVTHSASKAIQFAESYDSSGFITSDFQQRLQKPFVFIDYKPEYEMIEENQKEMLERMYQDFITQNKRDMKQDCSRVYGFENLQLKTAQAYLLNGQSWNIQMLLLVCSFLMLIWPFSMMMDYFYVQKYECIIVKKVKMDQRQAGYQKIHD